MANEVELRPIQPDDAPSAAAFLHENLNARVSVGSWQRLFSPPWSHADEIHGYVLVHSGEIVGVYAAVPSRRRTGDGTVDVLNLAAFCVAERFRPQSIRLIRALLAHRDVVLTDFSPSGNVIELNRRLGFNDLDVTTYIGLNAPALPTRTVRITGDREVISRTLTGVDAEIYRDHAHAPAARHVLVTSGSRYSYLVFRKDRRKRLPLFATPLYVGGDTELLAEAWAQVGAHLLRRHGALFTLAEERILGFRPPGWMLRNARPRMIRSRGVAFDATTLDYLYSELALIEW